MVLRDWLHPMRDRFSMQSVFLQEAHHDAMLHFPFLCPILYVHLSCTQVSVPLQHGRVLLDQVAVLPFVPWFAAFQTWCGTLKAEEGKLSDDECLHPRNVFA